jgi:transposase-like protein
MSKYQKQGNTRRTQKNYSLAFKLQVVSEIEKGELNKNQAKYKYGIQGRSTILKWLRKYSTLDWKTVSQNAMKKQDPTPEQRIKELETALEQEKLKVELYSTAIDLSDKQYGTQIRKKFLAKQLKFYTNKKKSR